MLLALPAHVMWLLLTLVFQAPRPTPTGLVLGQVVDAVTKAPIASATVTMAPAPDGAAPAAAASRRVVADNQGRFLYRDLLKGTYQIGAAELLWAQQQLRESSAALGGSVPPPAPPAGPLVAYGAIYYPGTTDPDEAAAVTVKRGEEKMRIDFSMSAQPTAKIEGRVVGPDGQPAVNVRLTFMVASSSAGTTSPTGAIAYRNLLPGHYTILAQAVSNSLWALQEVTLNGRDVSDLVLTLAPALTLAGRVVFDATTLTPPSDLTAVRVTLVPGHGLPTQIPVHADGTFQVSAVVPGRYRLTASPYAAGRAQGPGAPAWTVRSMMVKHRNVADAFFEIGSGDGLSDTSVTFTDRVTELTGKLMDAADKPAAGYYVVVFSDDRTFWIQGGRRLPAPVRSATDGTFRFAGLPPGTYRLAALTEVDQSSLADEAFLQQLVPSAITVTLAEGEKKVQDVRLGGPRSGGMADSILGPHKGSRR